MSLCEFGHYYGHLTHVEACGRCGVSARRSGAAPPHVGSSVTCDRIPACRADPLAEEQNVDFAARAGIENVSPGMSGVGAVGRSTVTGSRDC
jgi:hypothetical protein